MGSDEKGGAARDESRRRFIKQAGAGAAALLAGATTLAQTACAKGGGTTATKSNTLLPASAAGAGPQPSRLAADVIVDYSYDAVHFMNGAGAPLYAADDVYKRFLARLREFPPEVLIVGKEAPFTHSFGPVLSFGGENRTQPRVRNRRDEDPLRRLAPAEVALRVKAAAQFVSDAHGAGVGVVLPYVSPMTMFGDAESRLGFFEFYDRWDEYASAFQLGPRPSEDPTRWTQQDPEGDIAFTMGEKQRMGAMRRYSMCVNHPAWRQWQMALARTAARAGYDGLWMDNVLVHRCYCQHCETVAKESGHKLSDERGRKLVWLESYLRYFDDLRREGQRERADFFLAGNYIQLPFQRAVTDKLDLSMVEAVWLGAPRLLWPGGIWTAFYPPGPELKVLNNRTRGFESGQPLNNLWLAQLSYAMRGSRGSHLLYGGMARNRKPEFAHNSDSSLLAQAEGAAFGGGVAVTTVAGSPFINEDNLPAHRARKTFQAFARQRRQLFEGLLPAGDVALIVFPDRLETEALLEAQQVHDALLWRGVLADVINGETANESLLRRYKLVVVAGRPELPQWMSALPLVRSVDPITDAETRNVKKGFQSERAVAALRRTKLSATVLQRAAELRAVSAPEGSLVQACAWGDERCTVLHLLNFAVLIGLNNGGAVKAVTDLSVRLGVPAGRRVRRVEFHTPDAPTAAAVKFQEEKGTLTFKPPALRVYGVCEVSF